MGSSALGYYGSLDPLPELESVQRRGTYKHTAPRALLLEDDFLLSTVQTFVISILLRKRFNQPPDPLQEKQPIVESAGSWFRNMVV